jgi:3-methylfumaryl-CoA hydratase
MLAAAQVAKLAATLDLDHAPATGEPLPPLWHWIFFNAVARTGEIGPDGHPKRGGFLPPVPLPRRMWAASRINFEKPLRVGEMTTRSGEIANVEIKDGRSGTLVFVTIRYQICGDGGGVIEEENTVVYRGTAATATAAVAEPAPANSLWRREVQPDPVLLFRYSAVTFNGHRIHYDHPYVTATEGYPGLVVHGPLTATLLAEHLRAHWRASPIGLAIRARSPLFAPESFTVHGAPGTDGKTVALWAANAAGGLAMTMDAHF